ncbi:fungal hydrophobin [Coprinopsis marcescibilis]|uniref:Hydrophobin n=1 Tax=Coprinopsis marcescibilis TaxID=230819 RepID=A0A5C3L6Z1_COPMA|nr:fungal hydrophobin [Coprinopsis marcescibilis]
MLFKVFSALFVSALVLATSATDTNQCNGGQVQCCNKSQSANNLDNSTKTLLAGLNIDVSKLSGNVGVSCTAVNVVGAGGGSKCNLQQVCCSNNNFNGVVALGCTPINIGL